MYEYLSGKLAELTPTAAIVDAGGVGYYVNISLQTYSALAGRSEVKLYIHYIVREDAQLFYGFFTRLERDLFRLLIGVSGIGGNTARMVLSSFPPEDVHRIVASGQSEALSTVKGIGSKTAQRIIVELKDKIAALPLTGTVPFAAESVPGPGADHEVYAEALSALTLLGFAKPASEKAVRHILKEKPDIRVEDLIRLSLKRL